MKTTSFILHCIVLTSVCAALPSARGGLIFTIEAPGVQASTVPGVTTETFDSLPLGAFSGSIAAGTLSSGGSIVSGTASGGAFGGASKTDFYAVGAQSGHTDATLTLPTAEHYFGMWWPAGDRQNQLDFFNGSTLLGSFRVGDIIPLLGAGYFGNPNNGLDKSEPFVYLDFTTTGSDVITSVHFHNDSTGSGYEMDNFSIFEQAITPPGTPPGGSIPEVGSSFLMLSGSVATLMFFRRRRA